MGYQESFRPIEHLAEAAGIKRAIEDYKQHPDLPEYCSYCGTIRMRRTNSYFVCVGGQRCGVHIVADYDIDDCIPYDGIYADYFEDIDEALVEEAARERPDLVDKGYRDAAADYERAAEQEREKKRKQNEAADALQPSIEAFLKEYGPATFRELSTAVQCAQEHSLDDALRELECRGYLLSRYFRRRYRYWFADETIAGSYEDAMASAPSLEDKIVRALIRCGPLSVGQLSSYVEANESNVREIAKSLVRQGGAVVDNTGRPHIFSVVQGKPEPHTPDAA